MPVLLPAAILGAGAIGAGASIYAANKQSSAEQDALNAQNAARAQLNPFINLGAGAASQLGGIEGINTATGQAGTAPQDYSAFTNSPDYQFALQQGQLGLQRYENANGLAMSGGALKDAAQFNQGLATQQFGNYFNRLMSLSQLGNNAASAGVSGANSAAQTMGNIGASQASGIVGAANSIGGGINSAITNSLLYNAINRSSYAPSSPANPANPGIIGSGIY